MIAFARIIVLSLLSISVCSNTNAQRVSVGFWNVENLYDTIPARFYDDSDYTPAGRLGWNAERYAAKLANLARVIDDAGFDVLALAEVENEAVVRDLVLALADDYNYIHFTSSDLRGIDLAMIYKGDKFFPSRSRLLDSSYSREFLEVRGTLGGEEVCILVCHLPSKMSRLALREKAMRRLADAADSLRRTEGGAKLIVMGDFNCDPSERLFRKVMGRRQKGIYGNCLLYGAIAEPAASYAWDGRRVLFDNILLSIDFIFGNDLRYESGGVFVKEYMLSAPTGGGVTGVQRRGYPLRTFSSGRYSGGYSDHLPVFAIFSK